MADARPEAATTTEKSHMRNVVVRGSAAGFAQEIVAGPHRMTADEPVVELHFGKSRNLQTKS